MTTDYKTEGREYLRCSICGAIFPKALELIDGDGITRVCPLCGAGKSCQDIGGKVEEIFRNILV